MMAFNQTEAIMSHIKPIGIVAILIVLISLLYSNFLRADISFAKQPTQVQKTTTNPINEVESGALLYRFDNSNSITQMALDTKVQMNITGVMNRVKVSQTFINPSNDWAEGIYIFPLPTNSAVDHLNMRIGSRIIQGQIKERKEAKKIYNKAKQEGKKASLIEQQRPNIFTTSVANIAPGESITIEIEYQQAVVIDNDKFSIRFPMTIGQRYIPGKKITTPNNAPGTANNTHQVKDGSQITPPSSSLVDRPVAISINLKAGFDTASVDSAYHDIDITKVDELTQQITLKDKDAQAERDFELTWQADKSLTPEIALFTQQKGADHYLMLMATPPADKVFKQTNTPREVIFVVDSSGSMLGASMEQASKALTQAVNNLKPTDRFNIIDFDSGFETYYDTAIPAIDLNKRHAEHFIKHISANGGTQPLEAIKFAFNSRDAHSDNYLRQIIFLTDGQLGNEQEVFDTVRLNLDTDRLFTIGIGSAPNSHLMTKLAEFGKGAYTFIGSVNEVEDKMNELFSKLQSPALTNINVNFPTGINAQQAFGSIADLYKGEAITAVFKLNAIPNNLTVSGNTANGVFSKNITISADNSTTGIDTLWARRKIDQLMNKYHAQYRRIERDQVQVDITNLALEHHLVSKFTSLVAVEITPSKTTDQALVTKAVTTKVKAAKTATNSQLWMLSGLALVLLSVFIRRKEKV